MPRGFFSWAPDGSRLARWQTTDDGAGISVEGPDGVVHPLDTGGHVAGFSLSPDDTETAGFSWSPDGTKIAYADSRPRQPMTIIDVRSGKKVVLPPGTAPQWSPDGKHIAFARPTTPLTAPPSDSLWVVDPDGSHRRLLALGVRHGISWAPNGTHLAFARSRDFEIGKQDATGAGGGPGPGLDDLWTVKVNGSALTRISSWFRGLADLSWSPDGTRFTYTSRDGTDGQGRDRFSVFLAEPDGIHQHRLVQDADVRPIWSPAGNEIALTRGRFAKKGYGLFVVRPNGRGLRKLLSGADSASWSEDGRQLAANAEGEIWIVDIAGHVRRISEGSRYGYGNFGGEWLPRRTPDSLLPGTRVSWSLPSDSLVTAEVLESAGAGRLPGRRRIEGRNGIRRR